MTSWCKADFNELIKKIIFKGFLKIRVVKSGNLSVAFK